MHKTLLALGICLLPLSTMAQERPQTILVLDGSGSMWGQIDGAAKITIAQEVIGSLLADLPADQDIGLTVYGHRVKGDCEDIQTLVLPGGDTRAAISAAVNGIQPKGKTPLSAAVIQAAEALRFIEEKATVILVSDGRETCEMDPCAVGRQLEQSGVDFTAHVIGFDVTDPADQAELQCLADETGGTFRTAANASELAEAMFVIVEPEPDPIPVEVTFRATNGPDGETITDDLIWTVRNSDQPVVTNRSAASFGISMTSGSFMAEVLRPQDEATAEGAFTVGDQAMEVVISLPDLLAQATLDAPDEAPAGSTLLVSWTGPDEGQDNIQVGQPGNGAYSYYAYVDSGNPVEIILPAVPGIYELRYKHRDSTVIATRPITVTPSDLSLEFPAQVPAGGSFDVTWTGPDQNGDNIQIGPVGENGYSYYAYTKGQNPLSLIAPAQPGPYEVRYKFRDREVILIQPIEVTATPLALDFPRQVKAGENFEVTWTGPDQNGDNIQIGPVGESSYTNYAYTKRGNPVTLKAPDQAGSFEVRYKFRDKEIVLAHPITVTD
ncbi:VWA domain-containing protein [Actibacterium sp. 188UL27-1]|uniref:VWA domain-containing protein n=1 Tax=Actibacterium sp. 188UL27-1 TaxID=2786961 RepID=UPI0019596773|nr:VWA domain-containing protein [Actibacterium sp. 188UL27-1]